MSITRAPSTASRPARPSGILRGFLLAAQVICAAVSGSSPQEDKDKPAMKTMLVEPAGLERELKEPALRILDTRPQEAHGKDHIPGAVRVDVAAWQALGKSEGGFQDAKAWGEKVSALGIGADTRVVVYGSSITDTARIWWTLRYLGIENVRVLDGGWDLWLKEGRPTETAAPTVATSRFVPGSTPVAWRRWIRSRSRSVLGTSR
jgi:thiosulfate/3-mercaptopyruvate sulfurtransferase